MRFLRSLRLYACSLFKRPEVEADLNDELRDYIERQTERHIESGFSPDEARARALRDVGGLEQVKEECRDARGFVWVETILQDVRYAARILRKNAGFTIAAVLMLAGGIGANTAMFSIVHAVLLRPLPFQNPERLFVALEDTGLAGSMAGAVSGPDFADYYEQNRSFDHISAIIPYFTETFQSKEGPVIVHCAGVSPAFFPALGVKPLLGRLYEPREYHVGEASVILSYRFWQREFGGDPHIIGRILSFNQSANTVVGVMPPLPDLLPETDVWPSLIPDFDFMKWRDNKFLTVIGKLKPGVTPRQAEQDLASILRRAPSAAPNASVKLVPLKEYLVGDVEKPLRLLMAAVVLVLIITCANLANLLLARAHSRQREIAVRLGLGASPGRILQQFLTENWVLASIGGALGIGLASAGITALLSRNEANLPRGAAIGIDIPVLLFAVAISFVAVLLFGWAPAAGIGKVNLNRALRTGRSEVGHAGKHGLRLLVISEIAGSVVLLAAAGVLVHSFWQVTHVDPGFEPQKLLMAYMCANRPVLEQQAFVRELIERADNLPGVEYAAIGDCTPGGRAPVGELGFPGGAVDPNRIPTSKACFISPEFFRTIGTPMLAGRSFNPFDTPNSMPVVVVNELFAKRFWRGENPIGKRLSVGYTGPGRRALGTTRLREVVGVVANIKHEALDAPTEPAVYMPYMQDETNHFLGSFNLFVRAQSPLSVAAPVRAVVHRLRPEQPVAYMQTMTDYLASSLAPRRFNLLLFSAFAFLALLLATIGIYGVVAYSVSRRTREFGLRIALGATNANVLRTVIREGFALALIGIAIGIAAAPPVLYLMGSLTFGVSPVDPLTYISVALLFAAVTVAACAIPARKASTVDPMRAIGSE